MRVLRFVLLVVLTTAVAVGVHDRIRRLRAWAQPPCPLVRWAPAAKRHARNGP